MHRLVKNLLDLSRLELSERLAALSGLGAGLGYQKLPTLLTTPAAATTPAAVCEQLCARYFGRAPSSAETASATTLLSGATVPKPLPTTGYYQEEAVAQISLLLFNSPAFLAC